MLIVKAILIIIHQNIHSDSLPPLYFFSGGNTDKCIHCLVPSLCDDECIHCLVSSLCDDECINGLYHLHAMISVFIASYHLHPHRCTTAYVKSMSSVYSSIPSIPTYNHLRLYWKKQVNHATHINVCTCMCRCTCVPTCVCIRTDLAVCNDLDVCMY